jgi:hypothetical protein
MNTGEPRLAPPVFMGARLRGQDSIGEARTLSFPARRKAAREGNPEDGVRRTGVPWVPFPCGGSRRLRPGMTGGLDKIVLVCLYSSRPARRGARS